MRLFLAVELDEPVRAAALAAAADLRGRLQRNVPGLAARWVGPDNLHITSVFIGEVSDTMADAIAAALAAPVASPAFELAIGGFGAFPPSGAPRVLWLGARDGAERMRLLAEELAGRLTPVGFEPERRPYSAHLTVARVKDVPRGAGGPVRRTLAEVPADCGVSRVTAATLFRSRLSPRGAAYEPLLRVPLS